MPKSKSKTTKVKKGSKTNSSTKEKSKQDPQRMTDATTSDSDVSELPTSPESRKHDFDSSAPSSPCSSVHSMSERDEDDLDLQKFPCLVDGLRTGKFPYITESVKYRQFELEERRALLQMRDEIEMARETCSSAIRMSRNLCPGYMNLKISHVLPMLGFPKTFDELILKLIRLGLEVSPQDHLSNTQGGSQSQATTKINEPEPVFEESEQESFSDIFTPVSKLKTNNLPCVFPSPAKMAKFVTPKNNGAGAVFQFGSKTGGLLSTSKAPRPAKPGEVVVAYSKAGSPILQRRVPDGIHSRMERVEWIEPDGSKLEVDLVFRGGNDPNKLSRFHFFQERVQGIAASMSTIKHNRILPPMINTKGTTQSAKKKKPEWR